MNDNKILILDIETTGFLQSGGKIVEIGIVELDLSNGATKIVFDNVVHETGITKDEVEKSWIFKNSDITLDEIRYSKNLNKYTEEIQSIINSYPCGTTAYNNVFDFGFLENRGFIFNNKLPCPMKLSTNICMISKKRGSGYKWPSVMEAYKYFFPESSYIEKHRGADDSVHEASIVFELYKMKIFNINK